MPTPNPPLIIDAGQTASATALATLQARARHLSRQIGEAKKAGQTAAALIQERQQVQKLLDMHTQPGPSASGSAPIQAPEPIQQDEAPQAESAASPLAQGEVVVSAFAQEDAARWDAFVKQHPGASVYHLSGWRTVCQSAFGHECPYLLAEAGGELVGVLPLVRLNSRLFGHFVVSMPYFNYGGALCQNEAARQALLKAAVEHAQREGCSHMELRDTSPLPGWPARTDKVAMWLTLPDSVEALWQSIGSKVRAQIKKSREAQLSFSFGGAELLEDFYSVFAIHMRDLGTPVYSKRFFATILQKAPGQPVLVVGRNSQGEPVSVALLLRFGHRMEVPWASTLRSAHGANANMALYWQLLSYACEQGCQQFDFGRSTQDAPTHRFKKQWGAQPVQLHWHYWLASGGELPQLNPNNPKYRLAIGVWKRLPVWLTKLMGPPIVRNLP
jgi:FemAB-related protein (PEP-CTERM system-associated)